MSEERPADTNGAAAAAPSESFKVFVGGISWHTTDKALTDGAPRCELLLRCEAVWQPWCDADPSSLPGAQRSSSTAKSRWRGT